MVHWSRIRLAKQGTWVRSPDGELRSHKRRATKPTAQLLSPRALEPEPQLENPWAPVKNPPRKKEDPGSHN